MAFFKGSSGLSRSSPCTPGRGFRGGQVTVELLLVLPVFMMLLFFIMEMGSLAYQTILVHHCAYELARIGSLTAGPPGGTVRPGPANVGQAEMKMKSALSKMGFLNAGRIKLEVSSETTSEDPQPKESPNPYTHSNEDILVTLKFPAKLVFPFSSYFLSDPPRGSGVRTLTVQVRMPIEKPVFQ